MEKEKAKSNINGNKDKTFILGAIKKFKTEEKVNPKNKKEAER
ncbi:hypothetical protein [Clostridioides difficile]|nr:hypothetical protein [Clostridioides difficile]